MKPSLLVASCLLAAGMSASAGSTDILDSYTWNNRLLLIFTPQRDDPRLRRQDEILADLRPGLIDRDLVVIRVTRDYAVTIDQVLTDEASAQDLYRDFGIAPDRFAVLLIGKDGGVKLSSDAPVDARAVFDLIDSMPMRQLEMQTKGAFTNQD